MPEKDDRAITVSVASLAVSGLALAVSAFTAYFLLPRDDVRAIIGHFSILTINFDPGTQTIQLLRPRTITVINAGNRPVVFHGIGLMVGQPRDESGDCFQSSQVFWSDVKPFVLEAGKMQVADFSPGDRSEDRLIKAAKVEGVGSKLTANIAVCLHALVATPDAGTMMVDKELARGRLGADPASFPQMRGLRYSFEEKVPIVIIRKHLFELPLRLN